ncbi:MAG: hypothetical protein RLZ34_1834 [Pseudomonadota bacterium]
MKHNTFSNLYCLVSVRRLGAFSKPFFEPIYLVVNLPLVALLTTNQPDLFRLNNKGFIGSGAHDCSLWKKIPKSNLKTGYFVCNNCVIDSLNKKQALSACFLEIFWLPEQGSNLRPAD